MNRTIAFRSTEALTFVGALAVLALAGVAVVDAPGLTLAPAAAVAALAVASTVPAVAPGALLLAVLCVAQLSPAAALGLLASALALYARRTRLLVHPAVLLGIPISLYVLIGGPNISHYRGVVEAHTLRFILWNVCALLAGAFLVGGGVRAERPAWKPRAVPPLHVVLALLPGLIGLLWVVGTAGVAVIHPSSRLAVGGLPLLLAESLIAGLGMYCYRIFMVRSPTRFEWGVIGVLLGCLAVPGYRGWPLVGLGLVLTLGIYFGRVRPAATKLALVALTVVVVIAGGDMVRRATNHQLLSSQAEAAKYGAEKLPIGFQQLHMSFRESIALGQVLIDKRDQGVRAPKSLLLADLETMLPGKQASGGEIVGALAGASSSAGLTASAVGTSYMDLGWWCLALFAAWGMVIGFVYRRLMSAPYWAGVYFLAVAYSLHFFHRGIPKPSYVLVPLLFGALARANGSRLPASRTAEGQ